MTHRPSASSSLPQPQIANWRYETAVAEVETIIDRIESGELDLEDVFEQFAQAVEALKQCDTFLADHQSQVELLIETLNTSTAKPPMPEPD